MTSKHNIINNLVEYKQLLLFFLGIFIAIGGLLFFLRALPVSAQSTTDCAKKYIGDADCKADPSGKSVTIIDYAIWYSEFIKGCSSANLAGCGVDSDGNGNAMDANFNYPGTNYIATDTKVDVFDYAVWIQGFLAETGTGTTPTNVPTSAVTTTISPTGVVITPPVSTGGAFPGAEGFGAQAKGGKGGKVMHVTNLNGSGAGSFRECALATGARICIFRVAGNINLGSELIITSPYLTVAGHSAPGDGITFTGGTISIRTHNVIMRYVRTRASTDGINLRSVDAHDIILDHVTSTWGADENMSTYTGSSDRVKNVSIQWSIIAEGLMSHSKGLLVGYANDVSVHHNLFAHNDERSPRCQSSNIDIVNNVIYNYGGSNGWCDTKHDSVVRINYVGNYTKKGPNSESAPEMRGDSGVIIYAKGNIGPNRTSDSEAEWNAIGGSYTKSSTRFPFAAVTTTSAAQAYTDVLSHVGASARLDANGAFVSNRDSADARIINEVKTGTGKLVSSPGSMPSLAAGTPYPDADKDGMSDTWESAKGLAVGTADHNGDKDGDGVTNLEEFLGGTTP